MLCPSNNTDALQNIVPYDHASADRRLNETVYNRERIEVLKSIDVGAPNRSILTSCESLIHGAGACERASTSLVFNGLMSLEKNPQKRPTTLVLAPPYSAGPVETVHFVFDDDQRLRMLEIKLSNGDRHRIELRRFRLNPPDAEPTENPSPPESLGFTVKGRARILSAGYFQETVTCFSVGEISAVPITGSGVWRCFPARCVSHLLLNGTEENGGILVQRQRGNCRRRNYPLFPGNATDEARRMEHPIAAPETRPAMAPSALFRGLLNTL